MSQRNFTAYTGKTKDPFAGMSFEDLKDELQRRAWEQIRKGREMMSEGRKLLMKHFGLTGKRNPHGLRRYVLQALQQGPMTRTEIYRRVIDLGFKPHGFSRESLLGRISIILSSDLLMLVEPVGHGVQGMTGVRWKLIEGGAAKYKQSVKRRAAKLDEAREDTRRLKEQGRKRRERRKAKPRRRKRSHLPGEGVLRVDGQPVARAGLLISGTNGKPRIAATAGA